ncbi:oligosaccharide flippase family protein [Microgenomates group bacterium]|nr:oligosaccharide flippase family protein [Microgenomates group bacterium]
MEHVQDLDVEAIKKKTVRGTMAYFATTLFLNLVSLVANFFLMAYFSPADFGIYGFVMQINGLLTFFSDVGLASSLIQRKEKPDKKDYQTAFWTQHILGWLIFGVTFLITRTNFIDQNVGAAGNWILLSIGLSFPLITLKTIPAIKLTRKMNFSKLVIPQIGEQLVFNAVLIGLAVNNVGAVAYAAAILARAIVGVIIIGLIQPFWPQLMFDLKSFRQTIKFGLKFQANDLLARIKDNFFFLVVGIMTGPTNFGYISWAKQWSMYPYNLTVQNIMNITFPTFSRLQTHHDLLKKAIEKSLFFITLIIFPLITGMCLFITPLTVVFPQYAKWQSAIPSFILFTLSIAMAAMSSPLTNALNAIGQINKTLKLMVLWTVLTWGVTFPLMHIFGFNGVALSAMLISLTSFLPYFILRKTVKVKVWEQVWRQGLASVVMAVAVLVSWPLWSRGINWMLLGGAGSVMVYGMTILLLGKNKIAQELQAIRGKKS